VIFGFLLVLFVAFSLCLSCLCGAWEGLLSSLKRVSEQEES